jgi:hypothetical protein
MVVVKNDEEECTEVTQVLGAPRDVQSRETWPRLCATARKQMFGMNRCVCGILLFLGGSTHCARMRETHRIKRD